MATANHSASTNDSHVWETTACYYSLSKGDLPEPYFIIGDEAFICTNQVLSPWPGRAIGRYKDSFNYWLSHSRQCIERAFGMLTKRFGIYYRKFTFDYTRWSLVTLLTVKLHNLCIDRKVTLPSRREPSDVWLVIDNDNEDIEDRDYRHRATGNRRAILTEMLQNEGKGRPYHAIGNSRE